MPVLLGLSLLSGVISLILLRRESRTRLFILTALATLCVLAVIVLTRLVNVPINDALMTWSATAPPPNLAELWTPGEKVHTIRTILSLVGFACLVFPATTRPLRTTSYY
ncbi:MAG: hypothetical protein QOD75_636 [Blastocatellia bacterium]|jgi:uncharacterized membrane protein|nr:hypothetical protein [Blastocatellia bacterium]